MEISICTVDDLPLLAQMNLQLFVDEKNDNIPTIDVLQGRLKRAMEQDSKAFLFRDGGSLAGYALVKTQQTPCYLSHFFICPQMRRKHLGTEAFQLLMAELKTDSMDLDAFCWNERGRAFWKSLGFWERCIGMRKSAADK